MNYNRWNRLVQQTGLRRLATYLPGKKSLQIFDFADYAKCIPHTGRPYFFSNEFVEARKLSFLSMDLIDSLSSLKQLPQSGESPSTETNKVAIKTIELLISYLKQVKAIRKITNIVSSETQRHVDFNIICSLTAFNENMDLMDEIMCYVLSVSNDLKQFERSLTLCKLLCELKWISKVETRQLEVIFSVLNDSPQEYISFLSLFAIIPQQLGQEAVTPVMWKLLLQHLDKTNQPVYDLVEYLIECKRVLPTTAIESQLQYYLTLKDNNKFKNLVSYVMHTSVHVTPSLFQLMRRYCVEQGLLDEALAIARHSKFRKLLQLEVFTELFDLCNKSPYWLPEYNKKWIKILEIWESLIPPINIKYWNWVLFMYDKLIELFSIQGNLLAAEYYYWERQRYLSITKVNFGGKRLHELLMECYYNASISIFERLEANKLFIHAQMESQLIEKNMDDNPSGEENMPQFVPMQVFDMSNASMFVNHFRIDKSLFSYIIKQFEGDKLKFFSTKTVRTEEDIHKFGRPPIFNVDLLSEETKQELVLNRAFVLLKHCVSEQEKGNLTLSKSFYNTHVSVLIANKQLNEATAIMKAKNDLMYDEIVYNRLICLYLENNDASSAINAFYSARKRGIFLRTESVDKIVAAAQENPKFADHAKRIAALRDNKEMSKKAKSSAEHFKKYVKNTNSTSASNSRNSKVMRNNV